MFLHTYSLLGQAPAPANWHALFFGTLGLVFLGLLFRAWKQREGFAGTLAAAALGLVFFYLTSPYASDTVRWWVGALLVPVAVVLAHRFRRDVWKPVLIVTGAWVAIAIVLLSSPSVNLRAFEGFPGKAVAFHGAGVLAWLIIRVALSRTRGKQQAMGATGLLVILSLVMFLVASSAWYESSDYLALAEAPIATTSAEISNHSAQLSGSRRLGIFVGGIVGDPAKRKGGSVEEPELVSYYSGQEPGNVLARASETFFPVSYELRMADGVVVTVQGITTVRQTFAWPEAGTRLWQHGLHHGDPVVIWAYPGETRNLGDGERIPSLVETRIIAHGDLESFRRDFLVDLVTTSRLIGWIALACLPLSAIPLGFGVRHLLQNRSRGSSSTT